MQREPALKCRIDMALVGTDGHLASTGSCVSIQGVNGSDRTVVGDGGSDAAVTSRFM